MNFRKLFVGDSSYVYVNMDKISTIWVSERTTSSGDKALKAVLCRDTDLLEEYEIEALFPKEWDEKQVVRYLKDGEI